MRGQPPGKASQWSHHEAIHSSHEGEHPPRRQSLGDDPGQVSGRKKFGDVAVDRSGVLDRGRGFFTYCEQLGFYGLFRLKDVAAALSDRGAVGCLLAGMSCVSVDVGD